MSRNEQVGTGHPRGRGLGRRLCLVVLAGTGLGCVGSAANHEVLGDQAYADGRYADALVEYRLALTQADPNVRLRAKAGAAALRAEDLLAAIEEYLALARHADQAAPSEAADGLERVARAAGTSGSQASLAAALAALEQVAPARARGEFALQLAREMAADGPPEEVLSILLHAAAAAPDARLQDSLMYSYAETLRRRQRCGEAIPVYESLVRRRRDPQLVERARAQLARCASTIGWRPLPEGLPHASVWGGRAGHGSRPSGGEGSVAPVGPSLAARRFARAADAHKRARWAGTVGGSNGRLALWRPHGIAMTGTGVP